MKDNEDKFSAASLYKNHIHKMIAAIVKESDHEELLNRNQNAVNAMLSGIACILSYVTDEEENKEAVEDVIRVLKSKAEYFRNDFVQAMESGILDETFPEDNKNIH